jgi:isochorismate pyruvate lyase
MTASNSGMIPLRREIDAIDAAIVKLLRGRLDVVERVIEVKRREGLPADIPSRVEDVVARVRAKADEAGLPPDLAEALWRKLISWTIAHEEQHIDDGR